MKVYKMTNEEILKLINDKPDVYVQIIKARHKLFYETINAQYNANTFGEKLYQHMYGVGKCKQCNKETKFKSFLVGYAEYCSKKCSNRGTANQRSHTMIEKNKQTRHQYYETKKCLICSNDFESLIFRKQKCCDAKCSGVYVANQPDRIDKIKQTKFKKYGNSVYVNSDKAKQTCLEKYGVDNASKSDDVIEKIKKINQEKYGVDWFFQSDEFIDKSESTNLERYGVTNASQSDIIKQKVKDTFQKNYGVDNIFQHEETMNRVYEENIKKYGTKIPVNGPELKPQTFEKLRKVRYESVIERLKKEDNHLPLFTLDDYIDAYKIHKYKFQCKKCNDIFEDHLDGNGHPRCLKCEPYVAGFSLCEREIGEYVKSLVGVDNVVENDRGILDGLELDIYIPHKKVAIEYNGLFWHSENSGGKSRKYHLNKTEICNQKGIRLIHIFEDEWVYRKQIVKDKMRHILCENNEKSIYARKCTITPMSDCEKFLNTNHVQGNCPASIKFGAYYNDELVAVMTFGKRRVAMGKKSSMDGEYELLRFATNKRIVGIASKLFGAFVKIYNPKKVVTYADKRYSVGNLYEKMKFEKIKDTDPNYWYFRVGEDIRFHRFGFAKHTLEKKLEHFDKSLSEWQNMKNNGYDRIWDCGHILYEYNHN